MAYMRDVKEKVHLPLYDAFVALGPSKKLDQSDDGGRPRFIIKKEDPIANQIKANGNIIKFFVNVQNKTKLETNLQESGVLSHYNTFEARAMRVVFELPPLYVRPLYKDAPQNEVVIFHRRGEPKRLDTLFLHDFLYNSTTSLIVGEKVMIQAPTWFFPAGAGPANDSGITNGIPSPQDTFRFAEPVQISHQQNFRVEIEFPNSGPDILGNAFGPFLMWVVLDGYLCRDVQ